MLVLLSPAKTLDFESPVPAAVAESTFTRPTFLAQSSVLIDILSRMSPCEIAGLMGLSDKLAALNVARYGAWSRRLTGRNSKPALYAFDGDVYEGLDAASLSADDVGWAQSHVVMLSGLYGTLRPLDRIQPYRLEMGTRLGNAKGANLYDFWSDLIAPHLAKQARRAGAGVIVNLASEEYFKAVDPLALGVPVVQCVFEDWKDGRYKIISFYAKRARGLMARYAIQSKCSSANELKQFEAAGYAFVDGASDDRRWVFRRRQ